MDRLKAKIKHLETIVEAIRNYHKTFISKKHSPEIKNCYCSIAKDLASYSTALHNTKLDLEIMERKKK